MAEKQKRDVMPWSFVLGLVALVLGFLMAANETAIGWLLAVVGVVLVATGIIQRTLQKRA